VFSQAEVSLGQEWMRKLVILTRVTLHSFRVKMQGKLGSVVESRARIRR